MASAVRLPAVMSLRVTNLSGAKALQLAALLADAGGAVVPEPPVPESPVPGSVISGAGGFVKPGKLLLLPPQAESKLARAIVNSVKRMACLISFIVIRRAAYDALIDYARQMLALVPVSALYYRRYKIPACRMGSTLYLESSSSNK